ncbi:MAG: carboxypeptidase regulatory-like domain-containing protein, partial [Candidatus Omnitrophica bacterium]|nr:carboxypeptidase regulatory-like domain-containing protein [Candidatus Omnitrophota bacterium]
AENETEKDFVLTPIVIEYGAVAGTVFGVTPEDSAQVPLADALVSLVPRYDFEFPPALATIYPDQPAAFVQSATTDDEGHYQFNHVPVGLYDLFASARGWGRTSAPAEVVKDETAEVDLVIVHTPPPGPSTLEGTVWLQPEGAETVLEPASGAEVIAIPAEPEWFEVDPNGIDPTSPLPPPHLVTRTDEQGHYRFDPIRSGKYHVIASFRGYRSSEELVGIPPESVVTQDFVLSPILTGPGKVLGRVTFSPPTMMVSEPQPIAGAKVLLISQNDFPIPLPILEPDQLNGLPILPPDLLYETRTNERGYFEFPEVQPGHYLIQVSAEDFQSERRDIWVPAGETVTLHFDLIPGMGGSEDAVLEGGVFDSRFVDGSDNYRDPIVGATVVAIPLCLNCDPAIGNIGPDGQIIPPRITQTNERGRYRFEGMSAGAVAVTVIAEGYLPAIQYTHLPSGQTTVVNFYLEKIGGSDPTGLYGKVTQWTPYPTFAPVPVPGAHIYLEPLFPLPLPPTGPIPYVLDTVTDDQGNYRFPNLEPGPYLVDIKAEGFTSIEDMEVRVPNGQKIRQDFLLYPLNQGSASYLGHVFHVEGDVPPDAKLVLHPIPGATVRLVPDWLPVIEIFPPPNVGFDRTTNEEGEFYFEDLVAGGYSVTVIKEGYAIQSGHIQLEETEVLNQDWFLDPDADNLVRVRGRVQEDTGELDIFIPI